MIQPGRRGRLGYPFTSNNRAILILSSSTSRCSRSGPFALKPCVKGRAEGTCSRTLAEMGGGPSPEAVSAGKLCAEKVGHGRRGSNAVKKRLERREACGAREQESHVTRHCARRYAFLCFSVTRLVQPSRRLPFKKATVAAAQQPLDEVVLPAILTMEDAQHADFFDDPVFLPLFLQTFSILLGRRSVLRVPESTERPPAASKRNSCAKQAKALRRFLRVPRWSRIVVVIITSVIFRFTMTTH